jgi:hypothetical protein
MVSTFCCWLAVELSFKYQSNRDGSYIPLPVLAHWQHLINQLN